MKQEEMNLEGFTVGMAVVDALPVLLFGISSILIAILFGSMLFVAGAVLSLAAGSGKVIWKFLIALKKKNIWFLNRQFRYLMPTGFGCIFISLLIDFDRINGAAIMKAVFSMPSILFFSIGVIGIIMMSVFSRKHDQSAHANWVEQITNSIAQLGFLLGILFLF